MGFVERIPHPSSVLWRH